MKKIIYIALLILIGGKSNAQISQVTLQASGLTCSMCSNAINKSLKTLSFVQDVKPNIKTSSFEIVIKENAEVSFDEIKKKVEDAGFFVAKLIAKINFTNTEIKNDQHVRIDKFLFHFLNVPSKTVNGIQEIKILDKGFVTAKEFKKNSTLTKMKCYETGKAGSCCIKGDAIEGERIYHVTI